MIKRKASFDSNVGANIICPVAPSARFDRANNIRPYIVFVFALLVAAPAAFADTDYAAAQNTLIAKASAVCAATDANKKYDDATGGCVDRSANILDKITNAGKGIGGAGGIGAGLQNLVGGKGGDLLNNALGVKNYCTDTGGVGNDTNCDCSNNPDRTRTQWDSANPANGCVAPASAATVQDNSTVVDHTVDQSVTATQATSGDETEKTAAFALFSDKCINQMGGTLTQNQVGNSIVHYCNLTSSKALTQGEWSDKCWKELNASGVTETKMATTSRCAFSPNSPPINANPCDYLTAGYVNTGIGTRYTPPITCVDTGSSVEKNTDGTFDKVMTCSWHDAKQNADYSAQFRFACTQGAELGTTTMAATTSANSQPRPEDAGTIAAFKAACESSQNNGRYDMQATARWFYKGGFQHICWFKDLTARSGTAGESNAVNQQVKRCQALDATWISSEPGGGTVTNRGCYILTPFGND